MDWILVAALVVAGIGFGMLIAGIWYAQRLFEVQRNCAVRIGQMQQEKLAMEKMVRDVEIRERIYKDVPVERLLRDDDRFDPIDWSGA